jgi:hypothetical protein
VCRLGQACCKILLPEKLKSLVYIFQAPIFCFYFLLLLMGTYWSCLLKRKMARMQETDKVRSRSTGSTGSTGGDGAMWVCGWGQEGGMPGA